ncbi:Predicted PurR-regulated permease PerM [Oceanobacillus limi]|uniref:Predicted PurR-regulated permease PerM n=1 Tax=Oceanobacillus limi TaxID=930131 RepID=A0A1I0H365_9BACI|nr:AI-2E family transporter [Oceanobacillus limi]SET78004.1 Predicted PurR-regulated permease PerM [Oceanobacillus limi]
MFLHKRQLNFLYWVITGIFVFLFIYLLVKLFPFYRAFFAFLLQLFTPFLISCLIAYLLYPIVKKIHQYNIPKSIAVLFIYCLFFGGVGYAIYRVYPAVIHQLRDLNDYLPQLIEMYQGLIYQLYESTSFLPETVHDRMDEFIASIEAYIEDLIVNLLGGISKIFDMIIIITVIPVLVFYFLKDYEKIRSYSKTFIPKKYQEQTSKLVHAIDENLGNYIRGQLLVSLFVSLTSYIIFQFFGLKYTLLLAIIMGLTNLIPYFGPIIGAVPAVGIALTMSGQLVLFVVISIFIIQLIESNLLQPYIVGKSVAIHPVAIIFALLLGGKIGGVVGMIVAVPLLTISKVIVKHIFTIRRDR